jgi:hypothetical protein
MSSIVRFPLSSDLLRRLPRHPDWKYEMIDGEVLLSPRPRPLLLRRRTDLAVPAASVGDAEIRIVDPRRDRTRIAKLLVDVWADEDPYRSLENPAAVLRAEIERQLGHTHSRRRCRGRAGHLCDGPRAAILDFDGPHARMAYRTQ